MKKIIWCLFFLLIFFEVEAKDYYSDYSEYSDYQEEYIAKSDLVEVDTKELYHAYEENEVYKFLETKDGILTGNFIDEYTEWTNDINEIDLNKEYEEKTIYYYNQTNTIYNYLFIINDNDKEYVMESIYAYDSEKQIFQTKRATLRKGNYILLIINGRKIQNMTIDMILDKRNNATSELSFYLSKDQYLDVTEDVLAKRLIDTSDNNIVEYEKIDLLDFDYLFQDSIKQSTNNNFNGRIIKEEKQYRNHYIYYEQKVLEKKYLDLYLENSDVYKLDYEDKKILYRYKKRDKVSIEENIVIEEKNIFLEDYISYSTIPKEDIKITSNLNLSLNGTYQINFILPYKTVKQDIKVDIKENYVNLIKKQNDYIKYLEKQSEIANYKVDKKNQEIKEIIIKNTEKQNELIGNLNSCKIEKENLASFKNGFEIEEKEQSFNFWCLVIVIITTIFISINFVEFKRMKKNTSFVELE